jgi:hypothetical protein
MCQRFSQNGCWEQLAALQAAAALSWPGDASGTLADHVMIMKAVPPAKNQHAVAVEKYFLSFSAAVLHREAHPQLSQGSY